MYWKDKLISIYFLINTTAYSRIAGDLLRQSKNDCQELTDESDRRSGTDDSISIWYHST